MVTGCAEVSPLLRNTKKMTGDDRNAKVAVREICPEMVIKQTKVGWRVIPLTQFSTEELIESQKDHHSPRQKPKI